MNKTGRTQLKRLMMLAMAIMMIFSMAIPAMADVATPATAALTKILTMPEGTTTPTADFAFTFTGVEVNGSDDPTDVGGMPAIPSATVSMTAADVGTTDPSTHIKTVKKQSAAFDTSALIAKGVGVYVYEVEETANTYSAGTGETMTYTGAKYKLTVWVKDSGSGAAVAGIGVAIMTKDPSHDGTTNVGDSTSAKILLKVCTRVHMNSLVCWDWTCYTGHSEMDSRGERRRAIWGVLFVLIERTTSKLTMTVKACANAWVFSCAHFVTHLVGDLCGDLCGA